MLTDSHLHLYLTEFENDLHNVIQEAVNNKINRFLLPNIDNETLPRLLSICKKYKNLLFPMIGLHPCSVDENYIQNIEKLFSKINEVKFIGIGEIGIDLYHETKFIIEQKEAFTTQLNLANKYNLPVVIHTRNSFDEIYAIMKQQKNKNTTGIFHCFSGTYEEAKKIIDLGFYLGVGGILTFKNANLSEIIKKIDLKYLVLETDSPYLAPHPMRGKRNEPKFLSLVAQRVAEVHNKTIEDIGEITNQNIDNIFFKT